MQAVETILAQATTIAQGSVRTAGHSGRLTPAESCPLSPEMRLRTNGVDTLS